MKLDEKEKLYKDLVKLRKSITKLLPILEQYSKDVETKAHTDTTPAGSLGELGKLGEFVKQITLSLAINVSVVNLKSASELLNTLIEQMKL
jgi:hypothetical protein